MGREPRATLYRRSAALRPLRRSCWATVYIVDISSPHRIPDELYFLPGRSGFSCHPGRCAKIDVMDPKRIQEDRGSEFRWLIGTILVISAVIGVVYQPVFHFELLGDAYQLVYHAHRASSHPTLLFAEVDGLLRPSATWTLVADRFLWGASPTGYHTSNLLLFAVAAMLAAVVGRRLGLGRMASSLVAILWVSSPFTDEIAILVAGRIQILLAISWLVLIIAWPRQEESWNRVNITAVVCATAAAMTSKETWVVTPGLVFLLEVGQHRLRPTRALRTALSFLIAVGLYLVVYLALGLGASGYFKWSLAPLAKIPHEMAAFMQFEELLPLAFTLTWRGVFALAVIVGLAVVCWRRRLWSGLPAFGLLFLPTLPTLLVPYLPQRFTAIPFLGFLLVIAIVLSNQRDVIPQLRLYRAGVAAVVLLVFLAGVRTVRADLVDYKLISEAHGRLLRETEILVPHLPHGVPIVSVRLEREQPLLEILRAPTGLVKLPYTRNNDPYGLIDTVALFDWVAADRGLCVQEIRNISSAGTGIEPVVIGHRQGGFDFLPANAQSVSENVHHWSESGHPVRTFRIVPCGTNR